VHIQDNNFLCKFGIRFLVSGMVSQPPRLTTCIALESFLVFNKNEWKEEETLEHNGIICSQNIEVSLILSSVNIPYLYVKLFLFRNFLTLPLLKFKFN
jgi:hypothetical protein